MNLYAVVDPSDTIDSDRDTIDLVLDATNGETLVARELGRVITQYREAEHFLAYLFAVLSQVEEAARTAALLPSFFDIDTAVGEQLTFIGKRLGFPRCHCVCDAIPVFGFACEDAIPGPPIAGFCEESVWRNCGGVSDLCISDDDVYRAHLVARRYQFLGLYDIDSLTASLRALWGPTAWSPRAERGQVVIAPGRDLTAAEQQRFSITLRVLPIAPTMEIAVHYGALPVFGFGTGWAGLCDGSWFCPVVVDPYSCGDPPPAPLFGFENLDNADIVAGFGDDASTWAACLSA